MRFRVLGPLEVIDGDDQPVAAPSGKLAVLLVSLLLQANQAVPADRLIDRLWESGPTDSARRSLHVHMSRLRRVLGPGAAAIQTRGGAYLFQATPEILDLLRFRELVDQARSADDPVVESELLAAALALWRRPVLAELASESLRREEIGPLDELWAQVTERRIDLDLALGRHAELLGELSSLVAEFPLREHLWAQLMTALYRAGRQAEALERYQTLRKTLAEELGVEPGSEIRRLHQQVLTADPTLDPPPIPAAVVAPAVPAPRQLPADVPEFTGRTDHLRRLSAAVPVVAISGTGGVGKTALAVHWSHQIADRFPDGQLYLNLRGHSTIPPMRPVEALAQLLRALGVPPDHLPVGLDEQAALYRSTLAGRRVLVVLDNASTAEQVRPLLPGEPGCAVVITSRNELPGLVALHGVRQLALDVLEPAESEALLSELIGESRDTTDGYTELAVLCGHLPLALRIAGTHLATRPWLPLAEYLGRLRGGDRLAQLRIDGDPNAAVAATFDLSYQALPPPARRMFRLLGLHPGTDIAAAAATALTDTTVEAATRLLEELAGASLLDRRGPDRYGWHDLLHLYAAHTSAAEDDRADRDEALGRLFDHYVHTAVTAARLVDPTSGHLPFEPPPHEAAGAMAFADVDDATSWFDAERANLVAVVECAADAGPGRVAWQLADALRPYLMYGGHMVEWRHVAEHGLATAQCAGNLPALAAMRNSLGTWHGIRHDAAAAIDHLEQAAVVRRRIGDLAGECRTLMNLSNVLTYQGALRRAEITLRRARSLAQRSTNIRLQADTLGTLGTLCRHLGRLTEARDHLIATRDLERGIANRSSEWITAENLGAVYTDLGQFPEAIECLTISLDAHRRFGETFDAAAAHNSLAIAYREVGRVTEARDLARRAADLARAAGDQIAECDADRLLADCHRVAGRLDQAAAGYRRTLARARELDYPEGEVEALIGLAITLNRSGQPDARQHAEDAVRHAEERGLRMLRGQALAALADAWLIAGDTGHAIDRGQQALAIHRDTGHRPGEARTLTILGNAFASKDTAAATSHWRAARHLFAQLGMPEADELPHC